MDPANLEFTHKPSVHPRRHETDQAVQYGNLAEIPEYKNVTAI